MITSVQKVTRILTVVAKNGQSPIPLYEIAEKTGINKATCSHIISTLVQEGFIVRISSKMGYVLGPAAYCLSEFGRYGSDLISACRPVMQYLYRTLGHCVVLAVIEGSEKYVIDYIDDGSIFKKKQKIRRDDIYRTATGRAILENMSCEEIREIWERYGAPRSGEWDEIRSLDDLLLQREHAAEYEVILTRSENEERIDLGYALPIKRGISCVGAIGIAVKLTPQQEKSFTPEEDKKIRRLLIKGMSIISDGLVYR